MSHIGTFIDSMDRRYTGVTIPDGVDIVGAECECGWECAIIGKVPVELIKGALADHQHSVASEPPPA